jgi:hypothetical protein
MLAKARQEDEISQGVDQKYLKGSTFDDITDLTYSQQTGVLGSARQRETL